MSDVPDRPISPDDDGDDRFAHLPPELRALIEQLGGPDALGAAQDQLAAMMRAGGAGAVPGFGFQPPVQPTGPVDWELAGRVALQLAADGDRGPTDDERVRVVDAFALAEHWLDTTPLPAPSDAGRVVVGSRQTWVNAALTALRPLVEPVARASTDAMIALAREQFDELREHGGLSEGLEAMGLPPELEDVVGSLMDQDPSAMIRPAGAALAGLQAGQVIGQLAQQLTGQYDLGIPTAPRGEAHHLAVNVADDFDGYDLDPTEVAVVLAMTEAAHRRLYHAVPWLEAHVQSLVARFAAGTVVDEQRLREVSEELTAGVDPDDPESLTNAMERAAGLQLRPTEEQQRILRRLQSVICLVGAWARREVERAVQGRLPSLDRIQEVLRRRRATRGDGEQLLAGLLGLDIKPADETVGERFVEVVEATLGAAGLHRALAHPENLPDGDELADPGQWLARTVDEVDVPDDASALFGDLGDAPREASFEERAYQPDPATDETDPSPEDGEEPRNEDGEEPRNEDGGEPGDEDGGEPGNDRDDAS